METFVWKWKFEETNNDHLESDFEAASFMK